jgi:uncharacterized protein (DUF1501 family)
MNRREFIKAATLAGCYLPFSGISSLSFANAADLTRTQSSPLLLVLFLRGGADGLHLVAPPSDPDYIASRPPEMRVLDAGDNSGIVLDQTNGFRMHPAATGLAELYRANHLAIVHAVGITDGTRSHFVAQDLIERGVENENMLSIDTGWLTRALAQNEGQLPAYSATNATVFSMRGFANTLSCPDISGGLSIPFGNQTTDFLQAISATGKTKAHQATLIALDIMEKVDAHVPKDDKNKALTYVPSGIADYSGAGDLTRSLASVARLAKMNMGLRVACVDYGGWDTHEGQASRFNNQVKQLSLGLAAFHQDMVASEQPVITVAMTEFGRRLRANKSNGTDHGHGACWLVMGDGVRGGNLYGEWPGLSTDKLDQGVDLAVTTDYRTLLYDVLGAAGLSTQGVFPGWKPGKNGLGLFAKN